jgi:hypothetical protein
VTDGKSLPQRISTRVVVNMETMQVVERDSYLYAGPLDLCADQNTINRIGGLLKNVYSDSIVEQQNLAAVIRKRFSKAKGERMGGDHLEVGVRVGGNRAGVGARLSDDPLPTPGRQQEKKFLIYDRAVFGSIKVFDKDIQNSRENEQAFINHLDDEVTQLPKDILKHMNIMTYGDGSGTLTLINANTVNVNTFVGKTGTAFGQFGTRYMQVGDQIDIWDPTLTIQRTPAGGVSVTALVPATQTATVSQPLTLFAGDVVTRANSANKEYVGLQLATDNSSAVVFQGLSRLTFPTLQGNVIDNAGAALGEAILQQLQSAIETNSGEYPDMFIVSQPQWDAYVALGQSLKRYVNTMKLDRGFQQLDYNGVPFIKDVDCHPGSVFAAREEYVQNGVVTPLSWSEEDGAILKWFAGYAAYFAFMREYGNYVFPRPNALGRAQNLAVPAAYVR